MDSLVFRLWPLIADQHAIRNVMRGVRGKQTQFDASGLASALMTFCLFFVVVWAVARVFVKPEGAANQNGRRALFGELCKAHRLSRGDWWFLTRLARHYRLADPVMLFLDPQRLDPAACPDGWKKHAPRLRELQLKLFAGLASTYHGPRT